MQPGEEFCKENNYFRCRVQEIQFFFGGVGGGGGVQSKTVIIISTFLYRKIRISNGIFKIMKKRFLL